MDVREELVQRCAVRRREKIGGLSDEGFAELVLAVREDPSAFIDSPEEEAFSTFASALTAYEQKLDEDELLDDSEYTSTRKRRLASLSQACDRAAAIDPGCTDARLVSSRRTSSGRTTFSPGSSSSARRRAGPTSPATPGTTCSPRPRPGPRPR